MKIIFINWTKPFFERKKFSGYKKESTIQYDGDEYFLPPYEITMQIAAITSAKVKTGLPIKLITDTIGKDYYEKINLIDLFDEVDTTTLEDINTNHEINPAQFWTSGKIISICKEEPPFVFLDLDLILNDPLPEWVYKYDVVHTHWELPRSFLFIEKYMVENLGLNIPSFNDRMLIPNTSFLFVNNKQIQQEYLKLHLEIVTKKYDIVPDWLWLMSDQNILGYTLRNLNSKVTTFLDKTYIQFPDMEDNKVGHLPKWITIPQKHQESPVSFEHVWLDKTNLINNKNFRDLKLKKWESRIIKNGFTHKLPSKGRSNLI